MKKSLQIILLSGLSISSGLLAVKTVKEEEVRNARKHPKHTTVKHTAPKHKMVKYEVHEHTKKANKPLEVPHKRHEVKKNSHVAATNQKIMNTKATTPVNATSTKQTTGSKISNWLGLGAVAAPAATQAIANNNMIHHRGPAGFFEHHRFPNHWTKGWTGAWENGVWVFAGHDLPWWKANYPTYYKDVIRPEATRAGVK